LAHFNSREIISGSKDGSIRIMNWKEGISVNLITGHTGAVLSVCRINENIIVI